MAMMTLITLTLCDIKRTPAFQGLPPFFLTGAVIVFGLASLLFLRLQKVSARSRFLPHTEKLTGSNDSIERLANEYQQGQIPAEELLRRLSDIVCITLVGNNASIRQTSEEIISKTITSDNCKDLLCELFQLCDKVKFGQHPPSITEVEWVLQTAAIILSAAAKDKQ